MLNDNLTFDEPAISESEKAIAADRNHQNMQTVAPSSKRDQLPLPIDQAKLRSRYIEILARGGQIGC